VTQDKLHACFCSCHILQLCCVPDCCQQAVIACHCQRAAPTLTTVLEIVALTAPLIKATHDAPNAASSSSNTHSDSASGTEALAQPQESQHAGGSSSSSSSRRSSQHQGHAATTLQPPLVLAQALLLLGLKLARGWAPAVVVAQGVRLVGSIAQKREHPHEPTRQEGTEGDYALT